MPGRPMKVLFVISDLFFSEPLGVMYLSAMLKSRGHVTRLAVLSHGDLVRVLEDFQPDLVGYSSMTSDEHLFREVDGSVRAWIANAGRRVPRIMGGAHPTFFPQVLTDMKLDAICRGDGDYAILGVVEALARGQTLNGIPNIATPESPEIVKEVVQFMDDLPHIDRDIIYEAEPDMQKIGIRNFMTQRGCPYKCTYCFNHAYNKLFKGEGRKLIRRRSVSDVIAEVKAVAAKYPPTRIVRFGDDVFVIRRDEWLEEFAERFPREVGLPFYCLIRANALTEDVAELLRKAGCISISMSVEAGGERVRNEIMKRNMPDEMMRNAFGLARRYRINAYGNTILGVPGTTLDDDWYSYKFAKSLKPAAPTFGIFSPYPGTELTQYAIDKGLLPPNYDYTDLRPGAKSALTNYTPREKNRQIRLSSLASLFCKLPDFMDPLLAVLIRLPLTPVYNVIGATFTSYTLSSKIFPGAYPRDLRLIVKSVIRAFKFFALPSLWRKRPGPEATARALRTPTGGIGSPDYR